MVVSRIGSGSYYRPKVPRVCAHPGAGRGDGLYRLTRAQSGLIATEFTYDSASRLLTDTTAGRTIRYAHDDVNNPTQLTYPSGVEIDQAFDQLDRPEAVGQRIGPETLREAVRYRYRGPFLQKRKTLGNGVDLVREFDPARRRLREVGTNPSGTRVFDEQLTWSRRNLKTSAMRGDLTRSAQVFGYDGAQRVDTTARILLPTGQEPSIPSNGRIPPSALDEAPEQFRHVYDPAQNLVATVAVSEGIATGATMPPEGSGRNRPASVGGVDLAYDANGNLTGRGGETLSYDFRNRLTQVHGENGSLVATYAYDAFNRRVERQVGSTTETTVWNGWQAIEDYTNGTLTRRRIFGRGLDEIVLAQADVDGDGSLETEYSPLYDETGNLVALTGSGAQVFERYDYSPFGLQRIRVDARPPALGQVLLRDGRLRLEFDEPVQGDELRDAVGDGRLQLEEIFGDGTTEPVPVVIEQEVDFEIPPLELPEGLQAAAGEAETSERPVLEDLVGNSVGARSTAPLDSDQGIHSRRVFLRPTQPLEEGSQVRLTVAAGAIQDRFQNPASQEIEESFIWASTGTQVVADQAPPEVRAVRLRGNRLEIEFSEEPDLATLSAIELGPATAGAEALELGTSEQPTWQLQDDAVTVVTEEPLPAGNRELTIGTSLADLAGDTLPASLGLPVEVPATMADVELFETDAQGVVDISTVGNRYGFHGRPVDPETGLMYFRNRYYDPELGRFISADPLGYVDGPSMYGFAGYSPMNFGDPLGLSCFGLGPEEKSCTDYVPYFGIGYWTQQRGVLSAQTKDMSLTNKERIVAAVKVNTQIPFYLLEEGLRTFVLNLPHDLASAIDEEERCAEVARQFDPLGEFEGYFQAMEEAGCSVVEGPGVAAIPVGPGRLKRLATPRARLISVLNQKLHRDLVRSATAAGDDGVSAVTRAIQKHSAREVTAFNRVSGNLAARNATGRALVDEILGNPGTTFTQRTTGRFGEVLDVVAPDGRGLRFGVDGNFIGLLEPPR